MKIHAIYVKSTMEILYSRSRHDCRYSSDELNSIDGGFDYVKISGALSNIVSIQLDSDVLLKSLLHYDHNCGNRDILPEHLDGYHGMYKLNRYSNISYFEKLVINWDDVKDYIN